MITDHVPVLLDRCVELLTPALTRQHPTAPARCSSTPLWVPAATPSASCTELPGLRLIGLDRDPDALSIAGERLAGSATGSCSCAPATTASVCWPNRYRTSQVDGMLFDLGVSSMQLDRTERGFSYAADAPLDMRMDPDAPLTAADVVNTYDAKALARVLREFGEERFAGRIAAADRPAPRAPPFATTGELVELLYAAIPAPARRTGGHPAKRTFQALRIVVNGELDSLRDALPAALDALAPGGRIVVMAYQSLEDRIVKSQFAAATASRTPPGLPVELPGHEPEFVALTRGAETCERRRDRAQSPQRVGSASGTGKGCGRDDS